MATPAWASDAEVRLEYTPSAPISAVDSLQSLASNDWTSQVYVAIPEPLRAELGILSIQNLDHGVSLHLEVNGTEADREAILDQALAEIKILAKGANLPYAYRLSESPCPVEPFSWPLRKWQTFLLGVGILAIVSLGLLLRRAKQPRLLGHPSFHGLPVVGMLPAGFGMGGRFLELQTPPGQALGLYFRRMASTLKPVLREISVFAPNDLDASAVVTATLAISLLRERGRVLVVDLAGEDSSLPTLLEETDDAGELPDLGALHSTSIADLDLLTGLSPFANRRPPLPEDLLSRYRWILYHAPVGMPLDQTRHLLVLSTKTRWRDLWQQLWLAWLRRARVSGVVLAGDAIPARTRASYMARFYFEKLQSQEANS